MAVSPKEMIAKRPHIGSEFGRSGDDGKAQFGMESPFREHRFESGIFRAPSFACDMVTVAKSIPIDDPVSIQRWAVSVSVRKHHHTEIITITRIDQEGTGYNP